MKAKSPVTHKSLKSILYKNNILTPWTLVLGAGVSAELFPNWKELIIQVSKQVINPKDTSAIEALMKDYALEGLLQALKNESGLSEADFSLLLSTALYSTLRNKLAVDEQELFFNLIRTPEPGSSSDKHWESFYAITKDKFLNTTLYGVASFLQKAYVAKVSPKSVITFNAESFLHTVFTSLLREHYARKGDLPNKRKRHMDIITRSIVYTEPDRLPFHHIHGYLPVAFSKKQGKKSIIAIDKLVFAESEYLNLANSVHNWQSSIFLHAAYATTMVFVGVSFADINLRKWLGWTFTNHINEIRLVNPNFKDADLASRHFWITKNPGSAEQQRILENYVSHLGVRVIWINDYSEIPQVLKQMLRL